MMKQRPKKKYNADVKRIGSKDSGSEEETELSVRNKPQKKEIPTIEKVVEEGDTLQSLAIRYGCTIEDLKRLNSIHKENEIFAKSSIKVPHRPFTSALAGVHISGTSSPEFPSSSGIIDKTILNNTLVNLSNSAKSNDVNDIIFNSSIAQRSVEVAEEYTDDEEINLIPQEHSQPVEPINSKINCSGADGDISLIGLILCILVVIFVMPLIYVFYIAEHPEWFKHNS